MDFVRPVQSVVPGVQGRILAALARTGTELNNRTLADLSGVSPAQASRVLARLTALGIVERHDIARAAFYRLVEDHVVGHLILQLVDARTLVIRALQHSTRGLRPAPANMTLFGSLARGEAHAESDLDVLVVRPAGISEEDERWGSQLEAWVWSARRLAGNPVNVVHVGEEEVGRLLRSWRPLWREVLRDGVTLAGTPLSRPGAESA